ncbi:phosphate ABC transporter substrate-binding protein PstS [Paenibacillus alginolyticus]|uniref:Phosphate-binding protein n=1 Tax=Paenibacillus alginolyticus TaxID=59839 RepID=A0ABT4G7V8_9BACL|nr:phosphate ABC transporter substrate-binding protein PstS [Paenibacillus alginolyticus]MCY9692208.1 phosphate ABC transporter substrate-binding protein PstS [Paenibacillus alginolyticus]MEC0145953.1 phosphate ABC transporter substrate-binding protein PstS [Paenibacillus alginolyticus]
MLGKVSKKSSITMFMCALMVVVSACGNTVEKPSNSQAPAASTSTDKKADAPKKDITITAAGSTFVNPLFSKMFSEYNKAHPEIKVNYQSVGSGAGIKQLTEGTIDFGASDAFMNNDQIAAIKNGAIHIPVTVGAEAIIYNIDGVDKGVKLTQETLSSIFLGTITKWNDAKIKADNPDLKLPDLTITPVYRSDGSGTTAIFTDYLSTVSPEWMTKVGKGTSVQFPVGVGGKGNEGVAGQVKQTPGAIGYTELAYAVTNKISYAQIRNKDGKFVYPSLEAATIAAEAAAQNMPEDTRVSIVEKAGEKSYGIIGFTWALVNTTYDDASKKKEIVDLIKWVYRDGQQYSEALQYAKIPESIAKLNDKNLAKIK